MLRTTFCFAAAVSLTLLCAPQALIAQSSASAIYSFTGGSDGFNPQSSLVQAPDGNFYGTTMQGAGASAEYGTVFKMSPTGVLTTLYTFKPDGDTNTGLPYGGLTVGPDGSLYGVTEYGGTNGFGSFYKVTLSGAFSVLYSFCGTCADGGQPLDRLVLGSDGNFYGAASGSGTIFKITPQGQITTLASPGAVGPLLQASDGNFYFYGPGGDVDCPYDDMGTLEDCGAIDKMTPSGGTSVVFSFNPSYENGGGVLPQDGLIEGSDSELYGATVSGNDTPGSGNGGIFKATTNGGFTLLYSSYIGNCETCFGFETGLFLGSDSNYYGAGDLSAFQLTSAGIWTNEFSPTTYFGGVAPLVQGSDGSFYGVSNVGGTKSSSCGAEGCGYVYKIVATPALPAPVQISLSSSSVSPGASVTATFQVLNAFSLTMQQCYAFSTYNGGAMSPLGKVTGTLTKNIYTGSATFTAGAQGTYNFALTCGGIESGFATLTVAGTPTTTALVANPNPPTVGQQVTLTAQVRRTSGGGFATGTVKFQSGSTLLGNSTLNGSGVATFTASTNGLPPGSYPVNATYEGDSADAASTSPSLPVTLDQAPTSVTLLANPTSVTPPANVALTATVTRSASGATGTPTGTVTFSSGTVTLATVNVNGSGVASYSASSSGVPAGNYPVVARYNGDAADTSSTSAAVDVTVK